MDRSSWKTIAGAAKTCAVLLATFFGVTFGATALLLAEEHHPPTVGLPEINGTPAKAGRATGYPIPRFVSLKRSHTNVRSGPGFDHPVQWVYMRQGLPVEVTAEHNHWRQVRGRDGALGWVNFQMLDGDRTVAVVGNGRGLLTFSEPSAGVVATLQDGVILRAKACAKAWCRVTIDGHSGWIEKQYLWGVYPDEVF